jgi:hypothetical protein
VTDVDDIALTEEELVLAARGSALVAAAMAHPEARAPQSLRESLERARWPQRGSRRRRLRVAPAIAAVCLLVIGLVAALGGSGAGVGAPSVEQVAAATRLPALQGAPHAVGAARLSVSVEGLEFPDWHRRFGWRAAGRRTDRIGNRSVTTVVYRYAAHRRLGYAIVAGPPLRASAGRDVVRSGTRYRVLARAGRTTVTWTQAGHTCVIDAPATTPAAELVTLAAWGPPQTRAAAPRATRRWR